MRSPCLWKTKGKNDPDGTRTRVTGVKGRCPRPLDDGAKPTAHTSTTPWIASKDKPWPGRIVRGKLAFTNLDFLAV